MSQKKRVRIYKAGGEQGAYLNPTAQWMMQMGGAPQQQDGSEQLLVVIQQGLLNQEDPNDIYDSLVSQGVPAAQVEQAMYAVLDTIDQQGTQKYAEESGQSLEEVEEEATDMPRSTVNADMVNMINEDDDSYDYEDEQDFDDELFDMAKGGIPKKADFMRQIKKLGGKVGQGQKPEDVSQTHAFNFLDKVKNINQSALLEKEAEEYYDNTLLPEAQRGREVRRANRQQNRQNRQLNRGFNQMTRNMPVGMMGQGMVPQNLGVLGMPSYYGQSFPQQGAQIPGGYPGLKMANIEVHKTGLFGRPKQYSMTFDYNTADPVKEAAEVTKSAVTSVVDEEVKKEQEGKPNAKEEVKAVEEQAEASTKRLAKTPEEKAAYKKLLEKKREAGMTIDEMVKAGLGTKKGLEALLGADPEVSSEKPAETFSGFPTTASWQDHTANVNAHLRQSNHEPYIRKNTSSNNTSDSLQSQMVEQDYKNLLMMDLIPSAYKKEIPTENIQYGLRNDTAILSLEEEIASLEGMIKTGKDKGKTTSATYKNAQKELQLLQKELENRNKLLEKGISGLHSSQVDYISNPEMHGREYMRAPLQWLSGNFADAQEENNRLYDRLDYTTDDSPLSTSVLDALPMGAEALGNVYLVKGAWDLAKAGTKKLKQIWGKPTRVSSRPTVNSSAVTGTQSTKGTPDELSPTFEWDIPKGNKTPTAKGTKPKKTPAKNVVDDTGEVVTNTDGTVKATVKAKASKVKHEAFIDDAGELSIFPPDFGKGMTAAQIDKWNNDNFEAISKSYNKKKLTALKDIDEAFPITEGRYYDPAQAKRASSTPTQGTVSSTGPVTPETILQQNIDNMMGKTPVAPVTNPRPSTGGAFLYEPDLNLFNIAQPGTGFRNIKSSKLLGMQEGGMINPFMSNSLSEFVYGGALPKAQGGYNSNKLTEQELALAKQFGINDPNFSPDGTRKQIKQMQRDVYIDESMAGNNNSGRNQAMRNDQLGWSGQGCIVDPNTGGTNCFPSAEQQRQNNSQTPQYSGKEDYIEQMQEANAAAGIDKSYNDLAAEYEKYKQQSQRQPSQQQNSMQSEQQRQMQEWINQQHMQRQYNPYGYANNDYGRVPTMFNPYGRGPGIRRAGTWMQQTGLPMDAQGNPLTSNVAGQPLTKFEVTKSGLFGRPRRYEATWGTPQSSADSTAPAITSNLQDNTQDRGFISNLFNRDNQSADNIDSKGRIGYDKESFDKTGTYTSPDNADEYEKRNQKYVNKDKKRLLKDIKKAKRKDGSYTSVNPYTGAEHVLKQQGGFLNDYQIAGQTNEQRKSISSQFFPESSYDFPNPMQNKAIFGDPMKEEVGFKGSAELENPWNQPWEDKYSLMGQPSDDPAGYKTKGKIKQAWEIDPGQVWDNVNYAARSITGGMDENYKKRNQFAQMYGWDSNRETDDRKRGYYATNQGAAAVNFGDPQGGQMEYSQEGGQYNIGDEVEMTAQEIAKFIAGGGKLKYV
jgi:hypothetical protein